MIGQSIENSRAPRGYRGRRRLLFGLSKNARWNNDDGHDAVVGIRFCPWPRHGRGKRFENRAQVLRSFAKFVDSAARPKPDPRATRVNDKCLMRFRFVSLSSVHPFGDRFRFIRKKGR